VQFEEMPYILWKHYHLLLLINTCVPWWKWMLQSDVWSE